ncbi:MAG: hypothetical protein GX320_04570, partial [Tissierellia bacterium]|nr:hypothetical protein [Tissierellia bacterium]
VHVELTIDKTTNQIANEYCPKDNVVTQVFIQRNPPYNPGNHGGVVPSDYQYTAPTKVCEVHNQQTAIEDALEDEDEEDDDNDKKDDDDKGKKDDDDNIDDNKDKNPPALPPDDEDDDEED